MRAIVAGCAVGTVFACWLSTPTSILATAADQLASNGSGGTLPADRVLIGSSGIKFVYVPSGDFSMGSRYDLPGRFDDELPHKVTISHGFFMAATEISQAHFEKVMGRNLSKRKGPNLPVTNTSWSEATEFCKKLSRLEKRSYRLPTEAEWEYACRAGSNSAPTDASTLSAFAWHAGNSEERVHPVGRKKPNRWGLHDMLGNAAEWCSDWYRPDYGNAAVVDPTGPAEGNRRVVRGGSWSHRPRASRCSARMSYSPAHHLPQIGFRIVLEAESQL